MKARLNLATRPFRNEALPNLLFVAGVLLAGFVSVKHALLLRGLVGDASSTLHQQASATEQELLALRREAQAAKVAAPDPATLAEWRTVKELVDRRAFSWSGLLSRLQSVLPAGVRVLAITPKLAGGRIQLDLSAVARTREEGFELARALEAQGNFKHVYPQAVQSAERGEEFTYVMVYDPPAEP